MNLITCAKLYDDAVLPTRKHPDDAGIDLYAYSSKGGAQFVSENSTGVIHTGVTFNIPKGYFGLIKAKSKSNFLVGAGVVDAGYQGEILVKIFTGKLSETFITGDPVAQLLILPCETPAIKEVSKEEIHKEVTYRGATGGILTEFQYKEANYGDMLD